MFLFFLSSLSLYLSLLKFVTHPQRDYRRTPYKHIPFIPHAFDQLARLAPARSFVLFSHARSLIFIFT